MSSPEMSASSKLPSYIRLSKTISGYGACKHYNLEEHTYERAKSSSSRHSDNSDQFRSLPYDVLLTQFQNFRNIDTSSPTQTVTPISSGGSSFLQKKIASLYGNTFADDWQRSRSKSRQSNGSSDRSPRSPSCPPSRISENKDCKNIKKDFSPKDFLKQMKNDKLQQKESLKNYESNKNEDILKNESSDSFEESSKNNKCEEYFLNEQFVQLSEVLNDKKNLHSESEKFLEYIDKITQEFQVQIQKYEIILCEIDSSEMHDIMGKIRAAIGKGNLLISKKIKQFQQLCLDSLNQTGNEEFPIKIEDLEGFWDMITIQIDEVRNAFSELDKLKEKDWNIISENVDSIYHSSPSRRTIEQSPRKAKIVSKFSPTKSNETDSQRKARMNEMKRKAKERMLANQNDKATDEDICIFAASTTAEDLTENLSSLTSDNKDSNLYS